MDSGTGSTDENLKLTTKYHSFLVEHQDRYQYHSGFEHASKLFQLINQIVWMYKILPLKFYSNRVVA